MKKLMYEQTSKNDVQDIKSEDISKYVEIEESPFTAININGKWMIVMGNYVASGKKFDTIEKLKEYVESKPWELIVTAGSIFKDIMYEKKLEEELKNEK